MSNEMTAKLIRDGKGQIVVLSENIRFHTKSVLIVRRRKGVMLLPFNPPLSRIAAASTKRGWPKVRLRA
jgi:virulence-associated protein VagC